MALNKVDLCGVDTSKLPVLTNAQMQALADRVPEDAVEVIIESLGSAYIAPALAERIRARLPHAAISRATLGPVLAIHIGLDVIGVAWSVE